MKSIFLTCPNCNQWNNIFVTLKSHRNSIVITATCLNCENEADASLNKDSFLWDHEDGLRSAVDTADKNIIYCASSYGRYPSYDETLDSLCIAAHKIGNRYNDVVKVRKSSEYERIRNTLKEPELYDGLTDDEIRKLQLAFGFSLGAGLSDSIPEADIYDAFIESFECMEKTEDWDKPGSDLSPRECLQCRSVHFDRSDVPDYEPDPTAGLSLDDPRNL